MPAFVFDPSQGNYPPYTGKYLGGVAGVVPEAFLDLVAASTTSIKTAVATVAAITTYSGAALTGTIGAGAISPPRNITITTAGGTPANAPATATITGTDVNGSVLTEVIVPATTAATVVGAKCFATVTSILLPAAGGTGATLAFGTGAIVGLGSKVAVLAGSPAVVNEMVDGVRVLTGTFATPTASPPNGSYAPATAPNAAHDYVIHYQVG
jgi:hypothetical protein